MAMWLVTLEDDDGMWFDDPVAGDTRVGAITVALAKWPSVPAGHRLQLYSCYEEDGEVVAPLSPEEEAEAKAKQLAEWKEFTKDFLPNGKE